MPDRIWGLYAQMQGTFPRLLQGEGGMDAFAEPMPHDEEQLSTLRVYKEKSLVGVVQQNAHSGRALSRVYLAYDATIEKRVPERKRNEKFNF